MCVTKLPSPIPKLHNASEESFIFDAMTGRIHLNLAVRGGDRGKYGRKNIDAQFVAPVQLNMLDGLRNIRNGRLRSGATREGHLPIDRHEERGSIGEVPAPGSRAFLGNIVGDGRHKGAHSLFDCGAVVFGWPPIAIAET